MAGAPSIDRLLNLVPDSPDVVLQHLRSHPDLALQQDGHGYSLLHAATSYNHLNLLRVLVQELNADINTKDEDGETCLFNCETVDFAKEIVALGVDVTVQNEEGQTAAEKLDDEDEQPAVAAYLKSLSTQSVSAEQDAAPEPDSEAGAAHPPPPLPNGVQLNIGTMQENENGPEPDPEFRRRIEELAARGDFEEREGQEALRSLVTVCALQCSLSP